MNIPHTLYHVSPGWNGHSILMNGVDPSYDRKENNRIYMVEKSALHWAIRHVSKNHNCPIDKIVVFRLRGSKSVKRIGRGMYCCEHVKPAICAVPARVYLS